MAVHSTILYFLGRTTSCISPPRALGLISVFASWLDILSHYSTQSNACKRLNILETRTFSKTPAYDFRPLIYSVNAEEYADMISLAVISAYLFSPSIFVILRENRGFSPRKTLLKAVSSLFWSSFVEIVWDNLKSCVYWVLEEKEGHRGHIISKMFANRLWFKMTRKRASLRFSVNVCFSLSSVDLHYFTKETSLNHTIFFNFGKFLS